MDDICTAVMQTVGCLGTYKIISEQEFYDNFPENAEKSRENLSMALKSLKEDGYIDIKYSGGNLYCLAALKDKDPVICHDEPTREIVFEEKKQSLLPLVLAAFIGGAAGSLLISLIFALI